MNEPETPEAHSVLIAALEQVADAIVVVDGDDRISLFNAAAERLWACDRTDLLGKPARECLPFLFEGPLRRRAERRAGRPATPAIEELQIERCDGTGAIAAISLSEVTVGSKTVYMAVARDVTNDARDRRELQLLMLAANETDRVVLITDGDHRIVYVNSAFTEMFGYRRAEVMGKRSREVFAGRNTSEDVLDALRRRTEGAESFSQELFVLDKAGRKLWVNAAVNPILDETGGLRHVVTVLANITESKQLQVLQRDVLEAVVSDLPLREVMRLICERVEAVAPDIICSVLAVDEEKRLRPLAGPSLPSELGAAIDGLPIGPRAGSCGTSAWRGAPVVVTDVETDPLWEDYRGLVLPLGLLACWSSPLKLRDGSVAGTFAFYYREKRGPSAWHEVIVRACVHLCVLALEHHAAKEHIARLAYFDTLTGLPNRGRLREMIRDRVQTAAGGQIGFLFVDIDRFKDVNDTLGHSVGDRLLVEVAHRLQEQLGPHDLVGRYGGDEFVVLLDGPEVARAGPAAQKLIESLLTPIVIENMLLPVSASVGISIYPSDGRDEDTLLKHADTAMYQAKSAGGGTYRFFSPEMNSLAQERLVLGAALREAISRRQLRLNYQPQIDTRTGRVVGVEALARWTHPIFGEVSPARFIALAEECGLIEPIGQWALNEACRQMAAWLKQGLALSTISVNLSAVHFRNSGLSGMVAKTLARHGLKPAMLTIEITEGVVMDSNPTAIESAKAIDALGVNLSLDDFGTGYSSLSYLSRLPIDELKIDRGFMRDLENDKNAQAVVTAVIRIGQSLGLTVVAEGVETLAQRRFLAALNCDVLQGFLFAKALSPAEFEAWYRHFCEMADASPMSGAA